MTDYRSFGGMEDYRRAEANPPVNVVGQYRRGGDDGRRRPARIREDFLESQPDYRQGALSAALLESPKKEERRCGMTVEMRRQVGFTLFLIMVSFNGTLMSTLEQRFVGHLGKKPMAARSISFSVVMYFYGISSMWAAISTKIGRAVGAEDYASIGKYFKMALRLGLFSAAISMGFIYPFGPTVMKHLYLEDKPEVFELAKQYLYIHSIGCAGSTAHLLAALSSDPPLTVRGVASCTGCHWTTSVASGVAWCRACSSSSTTASSGSSSRGSRASRTGSRSTC